MIVINKVILMGRLTKEPELSFTSSNTAVCKFTLAVDRRFKSENGPDADFINIVAWKKTAEFASKYLGKGLKTAVVGSMQTRSWEDNDGKKHYATEVIADEVEPCEWKPKEETETDTTVENFNDTNSISDLPF